MPYQPTPSNRLPSASPRRSPRQSVLHQSLSPRRSPRSTTLHQFVAPRPHVFDLEVAFHVYSYHPPRRYLEITRPQSGALYYRTIPVHFNPFMSDGVWSYTPRSGVARISTLGRKIGDIHFSLLPGAIDATFYVCVLGNHGQLCWVVVERGFKHPLYPTHALFQRGRSAPCWVLTQTFAKYTRMFGGNFSVFND